MKIISFWEEKNPRISIYFFKPSLYRTKTKSKLIFISVEDWWYVILRAYFNHSVGSRVADPGVLVGSGNGFHHLVGYGSRSNIKVLTPSKTFFLEGRTRIRNPVLSDLDLSEHCEGFPPCLWLSSVNLVLSLYNLIIR